MSSRGELLSWAGCYIDGDGYLAIRRKLLATLRPKYELDLRVVTTSNIGPNRLRSILGGTVRRWSRNDGVRKDAYCWRLSGTRAIAALDALWPYFVVKRREADLAVRMFEQGRYLSAAEHEAIYNEVRGLKCRQRGKK